MSDDIKVRKRKLSEYQRDPSNPNKGSERGRRIIRESLEKDGPGRSAVVSADDVLLIGNQTAQVAEDIGITDVIEVEAPPNALVVVKRSDVKYGDETARRLRVADNRAADFHAYDFEVLDLDSADGLLDGLFREDELLDLKLELDVETTVNAAVDDADKEQGSRIKGRDPARQIKPVLYADQVAIFEQALRATGIVNRGEALVAICRAYLDNRPSQADG